MSAYHGRSKCFIVLYVFRVSFYIWCIRKSDWKAKAFFHTETAHAHITTHILQGWLILCAIAAERGLLEEAVKKFPTFDKLYLMRGQLEERAGNKEASKAAYQSGLRRCIHSTPLWTSLARLEEKSNNLARARAILEQVLNCHLRDPIKKLVRSILNVRA